MKYVHCVYYIGHGVRVFVVYHLWVYNLIFPQRKPRLTAPHVSRLAHAFVALGPLTRLFRLRIRCPPAPANASIDRNGDGGVSMGCSSAEARRGQRARAVTPTSCSTGTGVLRKRMLLSTSTAHERKAHALVRARLGAR